MNQIKKEIIRRILYGQQKILEQRYNGRTKDALANNKAAIKMLGEDKTKWELFLWGIKNLFT